MSCGVRNAKERYLEILSFQHFAKFITFTTDGEDFSNKVLKNKIEVSVVLDLECVDMFTQWIERVYRHVYITQCGVILGLGNESNSTPLEIQSCRQGGTSFKWYLY